MYRLIISVLVVGVGGWACGASQANQWLGIEERLPGGAILVSNPRVGLWTAGKKWFLEEDLRVGSAEGEKPHLFGNLVALEVDDAGRIYVFDQTEAEILVFSEMGVLLQRFGRRGAGPGEYDGAIGLALSPHGTIWVVDGTLARYTVIDPHGVRTVRREATVYRLPWLGGFARDGLFYDAVIGGPGELLVAVDSGGRVQSRYQLPTPTLHGPRRGRIELPLPFAPKVLRAFDPAGFLWIAVSNEYHLVKVAFTGDTALLVRREHKPIPLTTVQTDSVDRYARELRAAMGVDVTGAMIPTLLPVLEWMIVDDEGHLWVSSRVLQESSGVDLFDVGGRFLGRVTVPFKIMEGTRPVVRGSRLYAIVEDSLGFPIVVRARVRRP